MKARHSILVVDDETVVLEAARRILTAKDFLVHTADDAESALALMPSAKPDIAVVDLKLPGMSGIEFLEATRRAYPHVVVIVTTGYSSVDNAVASLQHGAFDFLPKPFTFDELLSPIHRACRYIRLSDDVGTLSSSTEPAGYHFLGTQAWAKPEPDGTVLLGWTEVFQQTVGSLESVVLPEVNGLLQQGGRLARLTALDTRVHVAWSALGGRVLASNQQAEEDPGLISRDPLGEGWIARIRPVNLAHELTRLRKVS